MAKFLTTAGVARRHRWCRRASWPDATLQRGGWRCYYATAGVALRRMPSYLWPAAGGCWLASSHPLRGGGVAGGGGCGRRDAQTARPRIVASAAP